MMHGLLLQLAGGKVEGRLSLPPRAARDTPNFKSATICVLFPSQPLDKPEKFSRRLLTVQRPVASHLVCHLRYLTATLLAAFFGASNRWVLACGSRRRRGT